MNSIRMLSAIQSKKPIQEAFKYNWADSVFTVTLTVNIIAAVDKVMIIFELLIRSGNTLSFIFIVEYLNIGSTKTIQSSIEIRTVSAIIMMIVNIKFLNYFT